MSEINPNDLRDDDKMEDEDRLRDPRLRDPDRVLEDDGMRDENALRPEDRVEGDERLSDSDGVRDEGWGRDDDLRGDGSLTSETREGGGTPGAEVGDSAVGDGGVTMVTNPEDYASTEPLSIEEQGEPVQPRPAGEDHITLQGDSAEHRDLGSDDDRISDERVNDDPTLGDRARDLTDGDPDIDGRRDR